MRNQKKRNAMEDNIELFDRYIDEELNADERLKFERRVRSEKSFATDFRIYLFTLRGIFQEAEQDNIDFGQAMKNISKKDLLRVIGRSSRPRMLRLHYLRERMAFAASIAAILIIGIFTVMNVRQSGMNRLDETIVAYNYIPDSGRGPESITAKDIPSLEKAYLSAPSDDIQLQEEAGMRLAMAYLKIHDRKRAKELLAELSSRFAEDKEFSAQCNKILDQLK